MLSDLKKIILILFIIFLFPAVSLCWYGFCQRNNDSDGIKFITISLIGFLAIPIFVFWSNIFWEENELFILILKIFCVAISLAQLILIEKKVLQYHNNPTWENYIK